MNWRRLLPILGILLVAGLIWYKFRKSPEPKMGPGNPGGPSAVMVDVLILKTQPYDWTYFCNGSILPNREVTLRAERAGRVTRIRFEDGQFVRKGDTLLQLFDKDLQARMRQLEVNEDLAVKNKERQAPLLKINGVSQQEFDATVSSLEAILAEKSLVKAQLEQTAIIAPFNGKVGFRNVFEGSYLSTGEVITMISELDPIKVEFPLPEKYLALAKNGTEIHFLVDGLTDTLNAKINAIEPSVDPDTRSFRVRATGPNPGGKLIPGAFARISLPGNHYSDALMVPASSLIPELKGQRAMVLRGGKAAPVNVETGIRGEAEVQVLSGLNSGDSLIITGLMQLRPGSEVKIREVR